MGHLGRELFNVFFLEFLTAVLGCTVPFSYIWVWQPQNRSFFFFCSTVFLLPLGILESSVFLFWSAVIIHCVWTSPHRPNGLDLLLPGGLRAPWFRPCGLCSQNAWVWPQLCLSKLTPLALYCLHLMKTLEGMSVMIHSSFAWSPLFDHDVLSG